MMRRAGVRAAALAILFLGGVPGCQEAQAEEELVVGLLLSYTGDLAANSINSERSVLMAVEMANASGGVGGRHIRVTGKDLRSEASAAAAAAQQLIDANAAIFLGLDSTDVATAVESILGNRTVILPSITTASTFDKPLDWFVIGAPYPRLACELVAQLRADGRQAPLVIADTSGFNSQLSFELNRTYAIPRTVLPSNQPSTTETVAPIAAAPADSYILTATPPSASSLLFALAAIGAIDDPTRWYLSPTLHTPALLETIPTGMLQGAHGVDAGTGAGAADFRERFIARWRDEPFQDAYSFYDAAAIAVLALQRAATLEGAIPTGAGLGPHVVAVSNAAGTPVRWNELARGLELIRQREEVAYVGLSGPVEFNASGQSSLDSVSWWTIGPRGFEDVPRTDDCASP
jgi:branched-chain amino acid transport system substrate-binding protein